MSDSNPQSQIRNPEFPTTWFVVIGGVRFVLFQVRNAITRLGTGQQLLFLFGIMQLKAQSHAIRLKQRQYFRLGWCH